jgi:hypothetical protein
MRSNKVHPLETSLDSVLGRWLSTLEPADG